MYEIRIHGRGGQGAVLASAILAQAFVDEGRFAVAIPSFGFERRGAPVSACLRMDAREIRALTNIYCPDCVICVDPTLPRMVDIFAGIKPGGTLVQASGKSAAAIDHPADLATLGLCDAMGIALAIFGRPITNSIMLGAFARTTGLVSLAALIGALEAAEFRDAGLEQNRRALERGYAETEVVALAPEFVAPAFVS
jgi:phenylglyoxylate dehydrogenase gamma subunit